MIGFTDPLRKPKARISIASVFLVLGILWPYLFHPATQSAQNFSHALRGMLFGISFGINLMAIRLASRQRCSTTWPTPRLRG